ncbi:hypothetical protein ONZ45_g14966 [Pleurotus djamor]|nr:hypothetical protein ONZ45_g14966 [Pleurotus djamor]
MPSGQQGSRGHITSKIKINTDLKPYVQYGYVRRASDLPEDNGSASDSGTSGSGSGWGDVCTRPSSPDTDADFGNVDSEMAGSLPLEQPCLYIGQKINVNLSGVIEDIVHEEGFIEYAFRLDDGQYSPNIVQKLGKLSLQTDPNVNLSGISRGPLVDDNNIYEAGRPVYAPIEKPTHQHTEGDFTVVHDNIFRHYVHN